MNELTLTYNNENLQDGYFAQIQRVFAIYSISKVFKFRYMHSTIKDVIVHQLDPHQSEVEIKHFLREADEYFGFEPETTSTSFDKVYEFEIPKIIDLIYLQVKYLFSRKKVLIKITNPYRIIERCPKIYHHLENLISFRTNVASETKIVAHIRRGIAYDHISPGDSLSRMISEEYYVELIRKIVLLNPKINKLVILTDAPETDFYYCPIEKDLDDWKQFERYRSSKGILIEGHKFDKITKDFPGEVIILRGGSPLEAVELMRTATFFLMSRSSMSFVGALLNKTGMIYYPPNFWHKPLKNWIKSS